MLSRRYFRRPESLSRFPEGNLKEKKTNERDKGKAKKGATVDLV